GLSIIRRSDIVAQRIIKGPVDDNSLNSTNHNFTELYDGKRKANERINNIVDEMSDEAFNKVVNSAKLDWDTMVEKHSDLPSDAETGTTIGVKEDGLVYRYDGSKWVDIYEINLNPISEVDDRLSSQLADADNFRREESMISRKQEKRPMITITDDDSNQGFYSILFELAKEYGIPMTSSIITNGAMGFPGGKPHEKEPGAKMRYSFEQAMEMRESGLIEVISHTHDHKDLIKIPNREIREDFEKSRNFMKKWGFNYRGVVYPFGNYNDRDVGVAKEFFDYIPGALGSTMFNSMVVTPPINNYTLPRQNINKASLEEIKGLIDETVEKNGWLILLGHIDQDDATEQDYRNIIEYALSKDVEFVKMDEGMKAHGNIAQFGGTNNYPETIITSEGDIIGEKTFPIQYLGQNGVVLNDSPQDKKLIDKITYSYINPEEKEDFPEESGGWLITNEVVGDSFSYQEYHLYHSNTIYRRWWMPSG